MGLDGRRPSHLSAEGQITPTSRLVNRLASHLLQSLVSLPRPSKCDEATRLGLLREDTAPSVQWRLVCPGTSWPPGSQRWVPIGLPSLRGEVSLWMGVTCGEWGHTHNLQYSFLIKLVSLSGKLSFVSRRWRKNGARGPPNSTPFNEPWHMPEPFGEYARTPQSGQKSGNLDTSNPSNTPSSS